MLTTTCSSLDLSDKLAAGAVAWLQLVVFPGHCCQVFLLIELPNKACEVLGFGSLAGRTRPGYVAEYCVGHMDYCGAYACTFALMCPGCLVFLYPTLASLRHGAYFQSYTHNTYDAVGVFLMACADKRVLPVLV
jgi:hypothetical protein